MRKQKYLQRKKIIRWSKINNKITQSNKEPSVISTIKQIKMAICIPVPLIEL
jgi:hypothetical protein